MQFEEENRFEEGDSPVRKKHRMREHSSLEASSVDDVEESDNELPEIGKYSVVPEYNASSLIGNRKTRVQGNGVVRVQTKPKETKGSKVGNWVEEEDSQEEIIDDEEESGAEYSTVDVNHNNGKVSMKLKKQ